jgi:hypothetical protein
VEDSLIEAICGYSIRAGEIGVGEVGTGRTASEREWTRMRKQNMNLGGDATTNAPCGRKDCQNPLQGILPPRSTPQGGSSLATLGFKLGSLRDASGARSPFKTPSRKPCE